jgi:copper chaperone CopZ
VSSAAQGQYHGGVATSGPSDTSGAQIAVTQLTVEGMHCGSCAALIEETLNEREGVTAAVVDLDSARAVIEYDPSTLDVEEIRAAIVEAGYSAAQVS